MATQSSVFMSWIRHATFNMHPSAAIDLPSSIAVIPEATFVQMLRLERRRTERSCKQLMLVLISSQDFRGKSGAAFSNRISVALSGRFRETDVLGWYERNVTLGMLMTEINQGDAHAAATIMRKVSQSLAHNLNEDSFRRLTLEYRLFPQTEETGSGKGAKITFYPELFGNHASKKPAAAAKRLLDIMGSITALTIFLPVFLIIALLIKLTSQGPVFFSQQRVGQHGKLFRFFKFRTMYVHNDPAIHREYVAKLIAGCEDSHLGAGLYKLTNDPRITPLGRFLRRSSLDELPQFLNVLTSDMSLVGPRPPLPYEYERYQVWHRRRVLELKPGITGLWQIKGRSRTTFDEMVRMDLRYASCKSFWTDCSILLQTPAAMLSGRGAC